MASSRAIQTAACLYVNAGGVVVMSIAILFKMVTASPMDAARKNTQATHVNENVRAI